MTRTLWMSVVAMALAGVPAVSFAQERDVPRSFEENARIRALEPDQMPREVMAAFESVRGVGGKYTKLVQIIRPTGVVFYRATIEDRNGTRAVYVTEGGRILSERDMEERALIETAKVRVNDLPDAVRNTVRRQIGARRVDEITRVIQTWYVVELEDGRLVKVDPAGNIMWDEADRVPDRDRFRDDDRDLYDLGSGRTMKFEDLPREVREASAREIGPERVVDVVRVERGRETTYIVAVESRRGERVIRVSREGRILSKVDLTAEGHARVLPEDLPPVVRDRLAREADGRIRSYRRIIQFGHGGRTWYVGQLDFTDGSGKNVIVDASGRLMHYEQQEFIGDPDRPRK